MTLQVSSNQKHSVIRSRLSIAIWSKILNLAERVTELACQVMTTN